MPAYYNENNSYAAQWLRNLINAGHIAAGDVDERSIVNVRADEIRGYAQCHFFAGVGGWSLALRLAGWRDDCEVWTGSVPCQPLSAAGQRQGHADRRHLWPAFYRLIAECRPAVVFGEQVASKDGREWLAAVRADLEASGYAVGAANLPACSVGAPHIRQRLWFVANADATRCGPWRAGEAGDDGTAWLEPAGFRADGVALGDADEPRLQGRRNDVGEHAGQRAAGAAGSWGDCIWLPCSDGKARPAQPGIFPLAHGVSRRVGKLRAYGNAIVPQVAAEFVKAIIRGDHGPT